MACMCGDTSCASCGPAQGFNPSEELFYESLSERFPVLGQLFDELPNEIEAVINYVFEQGVLHERGCVEQAAFEVEQLKEERALADAYFKKKSTTRRRCMRHGVSYRENEHCWRCVAGEAKEVDNDNA